METKEPRKRAEHSAPMPIPIGIEVLVKKAAIDPDFRQILLARRAYAADEIALKLEPSEAVMINAVPAAQLEAIVARTTVHPKQRAAFLGRVAAVMIVALSASGSGCGKRDAFREKDATDGIRPDRPEEVEPADEQVPGEQSAEDVLDRDDNRPIVIFGYTADENDRGN